MATLKVKLTEDYETAIVKLIMTQLRLANVAGPEQKKEVIEELGHLGITVMDKEDNTL